MTEEQILSTVPWWSVFHLKDKLDLWEWTNDLANHYIETEWLLLKFDASDHVIHLQYTDKNWKVYILYHEIYRDLNDEIYFYEFINELYNAYKKIEDAEVDYRESHM